MAKKDKTSTEDLVENEILNNSTEANDITLTTEPLTEETITEESTTELTIGESVVDEPIIEEIKEDVIETVVEDEVITEAPVTEETNSNEIPVDDEIIKLNEENILKSNEEYFNDYYREKLDGFNTVSDEDVNINYTKKELSHGDSRWLRRSGNLNK